jgi:predicted transcriptional regulator
MGRPPRRRDQLRPTEAEMAILDVLWSEGPCTVREVHTALSARAAPQVGYTSVLKLLQIMVDKGWAARETSARSHVYRAAVPRQGVQTHLVGDLVRRAFEGSTAALVVRALSDQPATPEELAQIRAMLDELEGKASP